MSDSETASRVKNSQSKSFRKLNPHLFPGQNAGGEDDEEHDHIAALTAKKKRIRQSSKPLLNKLESEFSERLKTRWPGTATWIHAQAVRLRLANGLTYSPDFFAIQPNTSPTAFEVKGKYAFEDSIVKLKVAASSYPFVKFILVWKDEQGQWQEQHVLP